MTIQFTRRSRGWRLRFPPGVPGFSLVTVLLIFAHSAHASTIPRLGDCAGDDQVTVDDLIKAVSKALNGCVA